MFHKVLGGQLLCLSGSRETCAFLGAETGQEKHQVKGCTPHVEMLNWTFTEEVRVSIQGPEAAQ